jgi:hypothetical protein
VTNVRNELKIVLPDGWLRIEPPDGVLLAAVAPSSTSDFSPSIVVTATMLPPEQRTAEERVDIHLATAIGELEDGLDDFELLDVTVTDAAETDVPRRQHVLACHRTGNVTVEMAQRHLWCGDMAFIVTATAEQDTADELIAAITACLDSVSVV